MPEARLLTLKISLEDSIGWITINRPDSLNALNKDVFKELEWVFNEWLENDDCKVVVITGEGNKSFVAGADIEELKDLDSIEARKMARRHREILEHIERYPKPVIAAINGYAFGGGLELALACHIRYASTEAKLGLPELKLALIPGYGGTQRLAYHIGKARCLEALLLAETFDAQQAKELGIVSRVLDISNFKDEVLILAKKMADMPTLAVNCAIKAVMDHENESYALETKLFGSLFDTEDAKEGIEAFLQKRKPHFSGK